MRARSVSARSTVGAAQPSACWSLARGLSSYPVADQHSQMATCQHTCGQFSSTQTGPVGGVWAALNDRLAFGPGGGLDRATTSPVPSGLAAHCPLCVRTTNSTPQRGLGRTGAPGRHAGTRSLRSDQPRTTAQLYLPNRAHRPIRKLRLAHTELARRSVRQECLEGARPGDRGGMRNSTARLSRDAPREKLSARFKAAMTGRRGTEGSVSSRCTRFSSLPCVPAITHTSARTQSQV